MICPSEKGFSETKSVYGFALCWLAGSWPFSGFIHLQHSVFLFISPVACRDRHSGAGVTLPASTEDDLAFVDNPDRRLGHSQNPQPQHPS